jgi:glutaredoxin
VLSGLIVLLAALAAAAVAGLIWRAANGKFRAQPWRLSLGVPLGEQATVVQFSTAFCAPCHANRKILTEVAAERAGVTFIDLDAESHLDLVRALRVRRSPTVFVLGPDGRIASRASGPVRKPEVAAALNAAMVEPR